MKPTHPSTRRQFIIQSLATALVFGSKSLQAQASLFEPRERRKFERMIEIIRKNPKLLKSPAPGFFVTLIRRDGMDCTLGLDPLKKSIYRDEKDVYLEYRDEDIVDAGEHHFAPSAVALKKHASELAVINGIVMRRDSGHESLREYMMSGDQSGATPIASAAHTMAFDLTAFGLIHNDYSIYSAGKEIMLSSASTLLPKIETNQGEETEFLDSEEEQTLLLETIAAYRSMVKKIPEVRRKFTEVPPIEIRESKEVRLVASSFLSGTSAQAQLILGSDVFLDTHSNHPKIHGDGQKRFWNDVSAIFDFFKQIPFHQGSLFDATTFFVVTEFSRTPALNGSNGKDHNPFTNSCLLAGRGVAGGRRIGASHVLPRSTRADQMPLHIGMPYDFAQAKTVSRSGTGVSLIYPENVISTLRQIIGLPENSSNALTAAIRRV